MTRNPLARVARHLRAGADPALAAAPDRQLLARHLTGEQEAFAELVRRHRRAVLAACRQVLADAADVEDAFQATFLVLVQRAKRVRCDASLGGWLFAVAHRIAVRAARTRTRTTRREAAARSLAPTSTDGADLSWREAVAALHEELDALPDRFRLPLILCYLDGLSRDEAAAKLGWKPGSVKAGLERGREKLRARLERRGVTLSAGLLAAVAGLCSVATASPDLLAATLRHASEGAPAAVLELTRPAMTGFTLKAKFLLGPAVAAALCAGLLAGSAKPTDPQEKPKGKEKMPGPPAKAGDKPAADKAGKAVPFVVNVRVKTPDGKPAANANVWVWADDKKQAEGKTDANGRLDLAVPTFFERVTVVAAAPGFAPDWAEFRPVFLGKQVIGPPTELTLAPEGPPVETRFTDLEGKPLANLPVEVVRHAKLKPGQTWDGFRKNADREYGLGSIDRVHTRVTGLPDKATTDKDGKVRIGGVGPGRFVSVVTRGTTHEHTLVRIACRELTRDEEVPGDQPLVGAKGTVHLAPARTIAGVVRDAKTGDPVPGMKVTDAYRHMTEAVTDKDGMFTLHGVKKQKEYFVAFGSAGEAPYFDVNERVADTPGLDPIALDVKAHRGVVAAGRVTDAAGKPVAGRIFYHWVADNPHIDDYRRGGNRAIVSVSNWGETDADGRYKALVIPGKGVLGVCGESEGRFPRLNARKEMERLKVSSWPVSALHALREVDLDPKDPKTLAHDFTLTPGKTRVLEIRGPEGKLPAKLLGVGHADSEDAKPVTAATLTLTGLSPDRGRAVVLMDEARTVGAVAKVAGDAAGPVSVALEKLGSLNGRVLDADGQPAAGAEVRVWLQLSADEYENLPDEVLAQRGVFGIFPGAWQKVTGRTTKTDKGGTFTLPGILPGQTYRLAAGFNMEKKDGELLHGRNGITVKPGEAHDLGDLKPGK